MSDFSKPQLGRRYANYENLLLPFDVTVDFWRRYGVAPEEVIFAKPGMWLAGPLVDTAATDDGSSQGASPEVASAAGGDPPAPEMAMGAPIAESDDGRRQLVQANYELSQQYALEQYWKRNAAEIEESLIDAGLLPDPDEKTEAAPVLEGQARLL